MTGEELHSIYEEEFNKMHPTLANRLNFMELHPDVQVLWTNMAARCNGVVETKAIPLEPDDLFSMIRDWQWPSLQRLYTLLHALGCKIN